MIIVAIRDNSLPASFFVAHAIDVNQWAVECADGNPLSVREVFMPEHSETDAKTIRKKTG